MNSEISIAIHSLVLLASLPDRMASSEQISRCVCTHPARVRKVLGLLKKLGYVVTKEGIGGGYILACEPDRVKLSDIYRSFACGGLKPGWCTGDPDSTCPITSNTDRVLAHLFDEAEKHMVMYLDRLTISDVLGLVRQWDEAIVSKP